MSTSEFDIVFRGDIIFGHQLTDVKQKLQLLFKADAAKVDALFTGRPVVLKRNLDELTANKYRDALTKAGAMVEVVLNSQSSASQNNTSQNKASAPEPVKVAPVKSSAQPQWTLAPVGSNLLTPSERPRAPAPFVLKETGFSLRPAQGNLLDATERKKVEATYVVAPNLDLAALGANLVEPNEIEHLPLLEIDIEDWGVAEAGSDLLTPAERHTVAPAIIQVGDFGLAPAGSDLGQLKPKVTPVVPDISGLSLKNS
jgi:hypothetical protein